MNYDFSLSENVSLSRILDQLINDNESPEVIINFLKMHDNDFEDIIAKSFCWKRIFQLDFIFECNDACIDYIVSKLTCISNKVAMYLVWQVCKSETELSRTIKNKFKAYTASLSNSDRKFSFPYAHSVGKCVEKTYDMIFFDACNRKCLVEVMCSMTNEQVKNYCDDIDRSLFKDRFLQYDVFSCLSDIQKFIVLRNVTNVDAYYLHYSDTLDNSDFIVQVLELDERPEVKYEAAKYWNQFDLHEPNENDYVKCSSFSELLIKMSIEGTYDYHSIIQKLLEYNRLDILKDWIEYDEAGFNEAYNISGLVKYMLKIEGKEAA